MAPIEGPLHGHVTPWCPEPPSGPDLSLRAAAVLISLIDSQTSATEVRLWVFRQEKLTELISFQLQFKWEEREDFVFLQILCFLSLLLLLVLFGRRFCWWCFGLVWFEFRVMNVSFSFIFSRFLLLLFLFSFLLLLFL